MLACVDVDYRDDGSAVAACVGFDEWTSDRPANEWIARLDRVEPYVPGALYRRELPCLLAVLARAGRPFDAVVVDAYVTLDDRGAPGLGAHLHAALGGATPVVGVAGTPFATARAIPVLRGTGKQPLWVTTLGVDAAITAERVRAMHGAARIPTLLRAVDRLARTA
ncbi:MAG: endonuclease V [Polyangiaceae bacterium]